jgi:Methyltransferase domain
MSPERYDAIGRGYSSVRRPDPRIAAQVRSAIGSARSVVNVGAGSGSYEPDAVATVAVEPSQVMIRQRPTDAAPVICAYAEALPFPDGAFDVAMAVLTVHHWRDRSLGLSELVRVSRRQVVVTWDPELFAEQFWFERDYLPRDHQDDASGTLTGVRRALGSRATVEPVPVPTDCRDGFYAAYWSRPEAYLDPAVRQGISAFATEDQSRVRDAIRRLSRDLASGRWDARHPGLREQTALDVGYRMVVTP